MKTFAHNCNILNGQIHHKETKILCIYKTDDVDFDSNEADSSTCLMPMPGSLAVS